MSDRLVRFAGDAWQEIEALPQSVRWTVQRTIFHLLEEPVPTLADPFPEEDPLPGAYELHLPADGVTIWYVVAPYRGQEIYVDLLSFLPPAEYGALLDAAGFSPDESLVAVTGTADPLLFDWRRVHQPARCDDDQRAALAACLEAARMRNAQSSFSGRPAQARRLSLAQFRSGIARWRSEHAESGSERDRDLDGFAHLREGHAPAANRGQPSSHGATAGA